jgi:hypothetical protein
MSDYQKQPFRVSRNDQGDWVVHFAGKSVTVSDHTDAITLADLPIQLARALSDGQDPDLKKVKRILALCDEYHLDRNRAVRRLRSWFKRQHADVK